MTDPDLVKEALERAERNATMRGIDVMDPEAVGRYRREWVGENGHDMAPVNYNSLRRLIALIDQLALEASARPERGGRVRSSADEQLIDQARQIHAKAMNCSDLAQEGQWGAAEDVIDPPAHNYWRVTALRSPTRKGVDPYTVTKALAYEPSVAGLLTFVSTALPQLCDLAERGLAPPPEPGGDVAVLKTVEAFVSQFENGERQKGDTVAIPYAACRTLLSAYREAIRHGPGGDDL